MDREFNLTISSAEMRSYSYFTIFFLSTLLIVALIFISTFSFVQTSEAFDSLDRSASVFMGVNISIWVKWAIAIIIQYGPNVALAARKFILDSKSSYYAILAFVSFSSVDAATNVYWWHRHAVLPADDAFSTIIVTFFGYPTMVGITFVEESIPIVFFVAVYSYKMFKMRKK